MPGKSAKSAPEEMTKEGQLFINIGEGLDGAVKSQMFGKPCFKVNGKAFACLFEGCMVFKLSGKMHGEALALSGSRLFDPSGRDRPMKEWVQVCYEHSRKWSAFAKAAFS